MLPKSEGHAETRGAPQEYLGRPSEVLEPLELLDVVVRSRSRVGIGGGRAVEARFGSRRRGALNPGIRCRNGDGWPVGQRSLVQQQRDVVRVVVGHGQVRAAVAVEVS